MHAMIDKFTPLSPEDRVAPRLRRIGVCMSPNMSLSSALLACEPLRSVNRFYQQPAYEIVFIGPTREPVTSGIGIAVDPATTFGEDDASTVEIICYRVPELG